MPTLPPRRPIRPVAALFAALGAGSALLMALTGASAQVPSGPAKPAKAISPAMDNDPSPAAELATFLGEYSRALAVGNRQFLADHTRFPLPFAEANYDMEAQARPGKLASVAALLKARQRLRWPTALVPKGADDLGRLRRGAEKCGDAKSPEVPDWQKGEPAIELHGDQATLTYLAAPCEAETHVVILRFGRTGQSWRLEERTIRLGSV